MRARFFWVAAGCAALMGLAAGCSMLDSGRAITPPRGVKPSEYIVITTGYCKCQECCGWTRNWYGRPTFASGPLKGKRKIVGQTASGAMARPGTIAADTSVFPFGTIVYVPGYGYGLVEDRGSAIKGYHLDLYYTTHAAAQEHGRRRARVKVWFPESQASAAQRGSSAR